MKVIKNWLKIEKKHRNVKNIKTKVLSKIDLETRTITINGVMEKGEG